MLKDLIEMIPRNLIKDERGWFLKVINGKEKGLSRFTGEVYLTCGTENQIKGLHYHERANEWFTLIVGVADLKLEDVHSGEKLTIRLNSATPVTIYIPPFIAHAIQSVSSEGFILCAYTDLSYDPQDTIKYNIV